MELNSILVIEKKENHLSEEIRMMKSDFRVEKADFGEAKEVLRKCGQRLVIFNMDHNRDQVKALARDAVTIRPDAYGVISAADVSVQDALEFMRLGIRDFLKQPLTKPELHDLIRRTSSWSTQAARDKQDTHELYAFFSFKGGVGTTLTAVNSALHFMKKNDGRTGIVDFALQHGNVAELLDMPAQYTVQDMFENLERLDAKLLEHSLQKHSSGLFVLPAPHEPEQAESFNGPATAELLKLLKNFFNYTFVDLSNEMTSATLSCLDAADLIVIVTTPDLPSLHNTKRALQTFKKLNYPEDKIKLVLNRWKMKGQIDASLIEKHISFPVFHRIPEDTGIALSAVNQGISVSEVSKNSELTKSFDRLAEMLVPVRQGV